MSKLIWIVIGIIALVMIVQSYFIWRPNHDKTVYMSTAEVYNEFTLKKELEKKLKKVEQTRQMILDSLKLNLSVLTAQVEKDGKVSDEEVIMANQIRERYIKKQQEFESDNENTAKQYSEQIWTQLNQYIKEYGEKHHYKYILGTNGEGVVMYADENENITKDVIEFVNQKYQGK